MATGFWKQLIKSAFREQDAQELEEEEAQRLRCEGHVRKHYLFSGRVQEVGFRYTALYIARDMKLTGWVANLDDGRVEMEVQGKTEAIDLMLCKLNDAGRIRIEHMEEQERPLLAEDGFCVRG